MSQNLSTLSTAFIRARQTNSTDASYPTRIPRADAPSGKGDAAAQTTSAVFDLAPTKMDYPSDRNRIILVPFGSGSDTNTFLMRVLGWRQVFERDTARREDNTLWVPVPLLDLTCTLSLQVGIVNKVVTATDRFCDTLALVGSTANDDVDVSITSPANDLIAHVALDLKGFQKVELIFDRNSSATSCNSLIAWY